MVTYESVDPHGKMTEAERMALIALRFECHMQMRSELALVELT
jgi:hypothetical protein